MILLRTFPLSFSILWRFIIVLPLLIIILAMYVVLSVFWGFILALFSWLLLLIILMTMAFVMGMIPTMIGLRLGLQTKGEHVTTSYGNLFFPALGYGIFEAMARVIIMAFGIGVFIALSPSLSFSGFDELMKDPAFAQKMLLRPENTALATKVFIGGSIVFACLRAALLPSYAGAAGGRDPNGQMHTPFASFGSGFVWLVVVMAIAYVLGVMSVPIIAYGAEALGYGERFAEISAMVARDNFIPDWSIIGAPEIALIAAFIIYSLWIFAIPCAATTLVYVRRREALDRAAEESGPTGDRMDPDELLEMVRSRMPKTGR